MKFTHSVLLLVCLASPTASGIARDHAAEPACPVFLLKRGHDSFEIEKVMVASGETRPFVSDPKTGIVDVILPVGPGGSGNIAQTQGALRILVHCAEGTITVTSRSADGKEWQRPARRLSELAAEDIRVNVSDASGVGGAFLISGYADVRPDDIGPVMDLFSGMVPLHTGDYSIFTDTYNRSGGSPVEGASPLALDRYPFVRVRLENGKELDFLVDIGAVTTVVARKHLPDGATVREASMVQYSGKGKKLLKYTPGGATGAVESVVGQATLSRVQVGGLRFENAVLDVLQEMPDFFGRPVAGILGMDLLRRCSVLSLGFAGDGRPDPLLRMSSKSGQPGSGLEVPFSVVKGHLVVKGSIGDETVRFILDTGAPRSFLDEQAAKAASITAAEGEAKTGHGLDGGSVEIRRGAPATLQLGGSQFENLAFELSPLPVFASMRVHGQSVGLLGNAFFRRFERIEIDFRSRTVRFVNGQDPSIDGFVPESE